MSVSTSVNPLPRFFVALPVVCASTAQVQPRLYRGVFFSLSFGFPKPLLGL